jgi:hypothetical protein
MPLWWRRSHGRSNPRAADMNPSLDLGRLARPALAAMEEAAREIDACQSVLAETGSTIPTQLGAAADMAAWTHYPAGDVYDARSHAQYFYHRHAPPPGVDAAAIHEHGHFHTFLRPRGMAPGTRPLMLPELAIADAPAQPAPPAMAPVPQPNQGEGNDKFSHLIAIGIDESGWPIRLFTTNRWVTGETWYGAADVIAMLDRFTIEADARALPVDRWLTALFRLYRTEMAALLKARDETIMAWRRRHHRAKIHVFEDRRLEIASSLAIDLADRMARIAGMAVNAA